jgi:8-hydroxy-5-deazaflavin:NADPH oxidoreductase
MSFFCRLINGRCMQEPRESERYPKTQTTAASSAPYPPPPLPRVMKIGIIGAGQIGGTLTRRLTALGHKVFVANSRGPETLLDLASETGATPVSVPDAVRGMDLVIVTIPEKNLPRLPAGLFTDTPNRLVVVDTGNYYPRQRDGRIEPIEGGLPESKWVVERLGRPVIKAFNNIYDRHLLELGRPKGAPGRIALPVAGDDEAAKAIVLNLVDQLGLDGVDAGGLDESWRQQPGTPVYAQDFDAEGVRRALSEASKERTPDWRGTAKSPGSFTAPA